MRAFNIVPQESIVDLLLAIAGTNFSAGAAGVIVGSLAAPSGRKGVAMVLASLSAIFAISMAVLGVVYSDRLSQSPFLGSVGSVAWVIGAALAAKYVIEEIAGENVVSK